MTLFDGIPSSLLSKMNFPLPFLAWLYTCISTSKISIVVNGQSLGYFSSERGIRQEDHISSYLFICVMECLTSMINQEVTLRRIACHPKCAKHNISSLMFADDLLVFSKPTASSIQHIMLTLEKFFKLSGLSINKDKSHI